MTADGSMKAVSELCEPPPAGRTGRKVKGKRGKKAKKEREPASRKSYDLQMNGGRFGNKMKLHDHAFSFAEGIIKCTWCNTGKCCV